MPVRRFDGDDKLLCSPGAVDITGAWTMAVMTRPRAIGYSVLYQPHDVDDAASGYGFEIDTGGSLAIWGTGAGEVWSNPGFVFLDVWCLLAISKASGTSRPRFHSYDFGGSGWLREWGAGTVGTPSSGMGSDGYVAFGQWGDNYNYNGEIAAAAVWDAALDDTTIDQLLDIRALADWASVASPRALWLFDQSSVSTPVEDLIGDADEILTPEGTSIVFEEPTIPYRAATIGYRDIGGWVDRPLFRNSGGDWLRPPAPGVL